MSSATDNTPTAPATLAATSPTPKVEQTTTATEVHDQVDKKEMTTEPNGDATADAKSDEPCRDIAGAATTTTVAKVKVEEKTIDEAKEVEFLKRETPIGHREEPATKEALKEEDATTVHVVKTTFKSTTAEEVEPPKDDTSKVEPPKAEATTKEVPSKEGALVATVAGEKCSASDGADTNKKRDGSPPKKVVESVSEERPATESAIEAEEIESLKGDTPMEQPVREGPAAKEAPKDEDAVMVPVVMTTIKSVPAEEVKPSKEDTSMEEPANAEAATKGVPNKEGALTTVAGEKRSASDAAVADEKKDGSPPKKVVDGMSKERHTTELVDVVVEKKEDIPCAHPISEGKMEKMVGTPVKV